MAMEFVAGQRADEPARRAASSSRRAGARHRRAGRRGPRVRARARRRAPRREAGQHHGRARRAGEDHGLRHRADALVGREDADRHAARLAEVHGAGAAARRRVSITAATSSRSAWCSTRWRRASRPSPATTSRRSCTRSSTRARRRRARSTRGCPRSSTSSSRARWRKIRTRATRSAAELAADLRACPRSAPRRRAAARTGDDGDEATQTLPIGALSLAATRRRQPRARALPPPELPAAAQAAAEAAAGRAGRAAPRLATLRLDRGDAATCRKHRRRLRAHCKARPRGARGGDRAAAARAARTRRARAVCTMGECYHRGARRARHRARLRQPEQNKMATEDTGITAQDPPESIASIRALVDRAPPWPRIPDGMITSPLGITLAIALGLARDRRDRLWSRRAAWRFVARVLFPLGAALGLALAGVALAGDRRAAAHLRRCRSACPTCRSTCASTRCRRSSCCCSARSRPASRCSPPATSARARARAPGLHVPPVPRVPRQHGAGAARRRRLRLHGGVGDRWRCRRSSSSRPTTACRRSAAPASSTC